MNDLKTANKELAKAECANYMCGDCVPCDKKCIIAKTGIASDCKYFELIVTKVPEIIHEPITKARRRK